MVKVFTAVEPLVSPEQDMATLRERAELMESSEVLDGVLIGYNSSQPHNHASAAFVLALTQRTKVIIAHRPGVMHPSVAARFFSTLDQLSGGRVSLNIIAGGTDRETEREGDYLPKEERYARATEYVELLRRIWSDPEPIDYDGTYFRMARVNQLIRPVSGGLPIYMGGDSDAALEFGGKVTDTYMLWGEPIEQTRQRVDRIGEVAAKYGRRPLVSLSLRLFLGDTDEEAWTVARAAEETIRQAQPKKPAGRPASALAEVGRQRQMAIAQEGEIHDDCFWTGIMTLMGGFGNTASLVGTPDRIMATLRKYVDVGVDAFLISTGDGYGMWDRSLESFAARMKAEL